MGVEIPKLPPKELVKSNPVGAVVRLTGPGRSNRSDASADRFAPTRMQRNVAVVGTILLVLIFWDVAVFLPLRLLVVAFHELGHAAAAILTGGTVLALGVGMDESGFTMTRGGDALLVLNGGYLGSILTGLTLLVSVRSTRAARAAAAVLGGVLACVSIRYYPIDPVGLAMVLVSAVCLIGLGAQAPSWLLDVGVRCLGWFCLFYSTFDIRDDVFGPDGPDVRSDAVALETLTGIAAPAWGLGWLGIGVVLLWLIRRRLG